MLASGESVSLALIAPDVTLSDMDEAKIDLSELRLLGVACAVFYCSKNHSKQPPLVPQLYWRDVQLQC